MRSFLLETDFAPAELPGLFALAREYKEKRRRGHPRPLEGQSWAMLFFKSSTRTRLSFEVGLRELGAHPVIVDVSRSQMGRGESIADTARIYSLYLHGLVIRCYEHSLLEEFAREGTIPVVNALSDLNHPCQLYADLLTLDEEWDPAGASALASLRGRRIAFFGDTDCNLAHSWMLAAAHFGFSLVLSGPESYRPGPDILERLASLGLDPDWSFQPDPLAAAEGADALYTDVWVSMGDEDERERRLRDLAPYQVSPAILASARPDAIFLHCLPAHPGEEVAAEVLYGPSSRIWPQAENRLHIQKAILTRLASS